MRLKLFYFLQTYKVFRKFVISVYQLYKSLPMQLFEMPEIDVIEEIEEQTIETELYSLVVFNQYLMLPQSSGIKRKNLFIIFTWRIWWMITAERWVVCGRHGSIAGWEPLADPRAETEERFELDRLTACEKRSEIKARPICLVGVDWVLIWSTLDGYQKKGNGIILIWNSLPVIRLRL